MEGYNVLFPMGFDSFGLPSENYAIKTGIHPSITTKKNIARFTKQLKSLGFSFDWNRVISTTDPEYYKWTQWIFLQFFKNGLAYKTDPRFIVYIGTTYEKKEIFKSLWNWSRLCIDRRRFF